jgi:3-(3-hydroxy-phenyl)propionate hydroxylase
MDQECEECEECVSVLIVGAGPTGLTAANLLGLYGIDTLLIERNTELNGFPRAISIDDEGLRICQALGLREEILPHVLQDLGAQYVSRGRLLVRVAPSSRRNGYPLISTFDQPGLEAALLAGLQRFSCIKTRFGCTLEAFVQTEQGVQASVRTASGLLRRIACNYLLACDGGKSFVRSALGIPMRGTTFPQRWLVADGICEDDAATNCVTFFCDPSRPSVSIPAPGQRRRWEFMLHPGEAEDQFLTLTNLHQLIRLIGGPGNPQIMRQTIYTFHAAYAASFAHKRIFLLGDAAHLLPPFGGQGMNCGLRDAHNLTWKLALVLRHQAQPGILKTYQQERIPHASRMIRFSSFLGSMIMTTSHPLASLRDIAVRVLVTLPSIASSLAEVRIKPEPFYKHGLLLSDGSRLSLALTGQLLPQPTVLIWGDKPVLLDKLFGYGFALLRLHPDPGEAFKPLQADLWQRLKPRYICIVPAIENMQETYRNITCVLDRQQQMAHFLRGHRDLFILVRPDRYVLGTFHIDREQAFAARLQEYIFS